MNIYFHKYPCIPHYLSGIKIPCLKPRILLTDGCEYCFQQY
jgi:hypothetical protein